MIRSRKISFAVMVPLISMMLLSSTIVPGLPSVIPPSTSLTGSREAVAQEGEGEAETTEAEGGEGERGGEENSDPDSSQQQELQTEEEAEEGATDQEAAEEEPAAEAGEDDGSENINHPPTADAGLDLAVDEGTLDVILSGNGIDEDPDDTLTYLWRQIIDEEEGGEQQPPEVRLNDADTPQATFDAPDNIEQDTTLTFELTVSDGTAEATDTVNVLVKDVLVTSSTTTAPTANEEEGGQEGEVTEAQVEGQGEGVELDAAVEEDDEEENLQSQTLPLSSSEEGDGEGEVLASDNNTDPAATITTTDGVSPDGSPIADNTNSTTTLEPGVQEEGVQESSSGEETLADDNNNNNNTNTSAVTTTPTTSDSSDGISPVTGNDTNTTSTLEPVLQEEGVEAITLQSGQSIAVKADFAATWNDVEDGSPQSSFTHIAYTGTVEVTPREPDEDGTIYYYYKLTSVAGQCHNNDYGTITPSLDFSHFSLAGELGDHFSVGIAGTTEGTDVACPWYDPLLPHVEENGMFHSSGFESFPCPDLGFNTVCSQNSRSWDISVPVLPPPTRPPPECPDEPTGEPAPTLTTAAEGDNCPPQGSFSVDCSGGIENVPRGESHGFDCIVTSHDGFNSAVDLTCQPPEGQPSITCNLDPTTVTPPADGSVEFSLSVITNQDTPLGEHRITVQGKSGSLEGSSSVVINVIAGYFTVDCPAAIDNVLRGKSLSYDCTITSHDGFNSAVDLICNTQSTAQGLTCNLNPTSVTPPADGTILTKLTVGTTKDTPLGEYKFNVIGTSGRVQDSSSVTIRCGICIPYPEGTPKEIKSMSPQGLGFLERWEGRAGLLPRDQRITGDDYGLYNDFAGHCTMGIGSLVHRGRCTPADINNYNQEFPGGMTRDQALAELARDVDEAENAVNNQVNVQLTQEQFDALVSFTFNVGEGNLRASRLLRDINAGNCDPQTITADFNRFIRAGNDPDALAGRRADEADLFNNGVY